MLRNKRVLLLIEDHSISLVIVYMYCSLVAIDVSLILFHFCSSLKRDHYSVWVLCSKTECCMTKAVCFFNRHTLTLIIMGPAAGSDIIIIYKGGLGSKLVVSHTYSIKYNIVFV